MTHCSMRRFVPFVGQPFVGPYLPNGAYHVILQCRTKKATIDLERSLQPHSNPIPSNSKNSAGKLEEELSQSTGSWRLSSTAYSHRRFSVSLSAERLMR